MVSHVRIKICGVTTSADAQHAAASGADAIGLNFYPRSPRCIPVSAAASILAGLPDTVDAVGVFVGEPLARIREIAAGLHRLRTIQWHGDQDAPPEPSLFRYIAAFAVVDCDSRLAITRYLDFCRQHGSVPDALLLDAHAPGLYGGTGRTAPWELLADFQPGIPIILAGGLTPDNVADAVRIVRPFGVDVASGVESRPGVKDPDKVRRFIDNARAAGTQGPKSKVQGLWSDLGPWTLDLGPRRKLP